MTEPRLDSAAKAPAPRYVGRFHKYTGFVNLLREASVPVLRLSPGFYWAVRTAALPIVRTRTRSPPPLVRDVARYDFLFSRAWTNFAAITGPFIEEIRWPLGRVYNLQLEAVDAELYYCMIRRLRPGLILEVGSGNSAWTASEALRANGKGRVVAIDPNPRLVLPRGCEHIAARAQDVERKEFERLEPNDILFVDASHTTEEAKYMTTSVLKILRPGTYVHFHDILFPYDVHVDGDADRYGEPDVLLEFLRENQETFEVVTGSAFVCYERPQEVAKLVSSFRYDLNRRPGSLWIRKRVPGEASPGP